MWFDFNLGVDRPFKLFVIRDILISYIYIYIYKYIYIYMYIYVCIYTYISSLPRVNPTSSTSSNTNTTLSIEGTLHFVLLLYNKDARVVHPVQRFEAVMPGIFCVRVTPKYLLQRKH